MAIIPSQKLFSKYHYRENCFNCVSHISHIPERHFLPYIQQRRLFTFCVCSVVNPVTQATTMKLVQLSNSARHPGGRRWDYYPGASSLIQVVAFYFKIGIHTLLPSLPFKDIAETRQHNWALQWRHNEHDSVSNHQRLHCLLNCRFRRRSKKTSKLSVTGLCAGNSPVTGEFPTQRTSNAVFFDAYPAQF